MKKFISRIKAKLGATSGESIAETLVSILIIVTMFAALAMAVVTSANINAMAKEDAGDNTFSYSGDGEGVISSSYPVEVTCELEPSLNSEANVTMKQDKDGHKYQYYVRNKTADDQNDNN